MSTGFVLNIPQEMINRLEDADKKIEKLAKTSEDAQVKIVSAFKSINTHGIDAFINKLTEAQTKLSQLGNTQINTSANAGAFAGLTSQAQNVIDEVNRIVAAMGKVKKAAGDTGMAKNPFAGMTESLKDWNALQSKIDEADQKIKKLTSTTMDYERQMERMRSGQTVPINISYNEYAYTKERIAALQEEKRVLREKQEEITRQNNALSEQVRIQESLKRFVANQNSLPEQRKRQEYEAMRQMYIEDEKASEAAEKKKVKDAEKAEKERQKLREKRIREEETAAERERKAYERMYKQLPATINTKQAGQLVARSMDATSINQRLVAIKNLQAAINNLDSTDKRYDQTVRKLNSEINRQKEELKKLGVEIDKVGKQHRGLLDISGQLARKLALVFSVSQITGYVKKLIEVRGEFELQQRSLQAILQNKDEANRIWQQTVDLAVRSPFRVKELVSYTKQLAAYRIESDKLFETNKMLADISAGLGVDMQRLILAFGQVRSAAYLRGTELRQFTEAGIPILEQLAQYFTELEGRAVSVGDVFERVSKRMVSFADVEEIFRRMTSEGGTFYRMQEIQAETLQGQISNLKDSVDIMLNEIGKAYEGTLKNSISFVRSLIENWESLANTLKVFVAAFAMTKLNALLAKESVMLLAIDMGILTNASQKQLTVTQLLSVGWNSFTKSIKNAAKGMKDFVVANPKVAAVLLLVSAFWKVGKAAWDFRNTLKEIDKQYASIADKQASAFVGFRNALNEGDLQKQKAALSNLINLANNEYNMEVKIDITGLSEEELNEEFNKLRQKLIEANAFASEFAKAQERSNQRDKWWSMSAFLGWDDDMFEDIDDMGDAYTKLNNRMVNMLPSTINMLQEKFDSLSESQKELLESLNTPIKKDESLVDYFNRLKIAFESLSEEGFVDDNKFNRFFRQFERSSRRAKEEFNAFIESFNDEAMSIADKDERTFFLDIAIDKYSSEKNWSKFEENQIRKWIEDAYNIKFNMVMADGSQTLEPWADRVYGAISKINDEIKKKSEGVSDADLFPLPKVGQTKEAYIALAKEVIGIAEMTYNETQQIEDESMVNRTKALAPYADEVRKILNLYKETTKGDGDKDTFTPMLRTVKEIYQEFKKLQGSFDDLTAKEGALAKFGDAFKEAFGKTPEEMGFDLFSEEGVKKAYDYLISKAPDVKKKIQAQLAKGEIVWDVKLQKKKDTDKELLDNVQELFDRYDLSLELKRLNIPPDLAKSLFDVDYLDLDGLKKAVESQKEEFIGKDMLKEYDELMKKIADMEDKAAKERMKTYVEYARSAIGERAKIKLEELKKLKEIEETFAEKEGDSEETKKYKREQKQLASEKAKKESSDAMQKLEWEDFQKSDMFINIFEDLDGASDALLNHMIQKLQEFKNEWTDMPLEDMKKIVDKINELQMALVENNPWEAYKKSKEAVKDAMKGATFESEDAKTTFGDGKSQSAFMQALQLENVYQEQKKLNAQEELGYLETALRIKEGQATEEEKILEKQEDYNKYLRMSPSELKKQISAQKTIVKNAEDILSANEDTLTESQKQAKALLKQADNLGKAQQMANDLYDAFSGLAEALGADSDSPAAIFADMGMNMLNTVLNTIQLQIQLNAATIAANELGIAMNSAMGVVGWIVMAIQLVAQAITAIVNYADKQKEKEIERLAKRVEDLREKFEDLNEAIDEAWSTSQLSTYKNELDQTYKIAIAAQKAIVAARADEKKVRKGKTDSEEYKQWEEAKKELEELEQEYADITQNIYSQVTDSILDSVHDAAREFTDAWWDAFIETGDGLSGLEENFNEMFLNLAKNQAAMQITGAFADRWKKDLEKYINEDDTELTKDEAKKWAEEVRRTFPELNEALEGYLGAFADMAEKTEGGKLSELQKGIQGVTEQTAQVLEALLNSMRYYVADSNAKLTQLLNNMMGGETESPMLVELRAQTKWMRDIYNLINGMTTAHPNGGRGIKTVM